MMANPGSPGLRVFMQGRMRGDNCWILILFPRGDRTPPRTAYTRERVKGVRRSALYPSL